MDRSRADGRHAPLAERIQNLGWQLGVCLIVTGTPLEADSERLVRIDRLKTDETLAVLHLHHATVRLLNPVTETSLTTNPHDRPLAGLQHASMDFGQQGTTLINGQVVPLTDLCLQVSVRDPGKFRPQRRSTDKHEPAGPEYGEGATQPRAFKHHSRP